MNRSILGGDFAQFLFSFGLCAYMAATQLQQRFIRSSLSATRRIGGIEEDSGRLAAVVAEARPDQLRGDCHLVDSRSIGRRLCLGLV